jgi:isopenicillin N synthase-like dioxygenase
MAPYAAAKVIAASAIPVIDIAPIVGGDAGGYRQVAKAMRSAAESIGFFYIKNHGIAAATIAAALAAAKEFFALPQEEKLAVRISDRHRGFIPIGEAKMYERAKIDLKESYIWGIEVAPGDPELAVNRLLGVNRWPARPPQMRAALSTFLAANLECGRLMFRAFAASLDLPLDYFVAKYDRPAARGSVLYYPPQDADLGEDQFGVATHTDYGCLTFVHQDPIGGLQVATKEGEWVTATPVADTIVVNVGDLMARWSNNHFKSTPHRVVNTARVPRYSMAVFLDPNADTVVVPACENEPPLFEPVTVGAYVTGRFDASFAYRRKA